MKIPMTLSFSNSQLFFIVYQKPRQKTWPLLTWEAACQSQRSWYQDETPAKEWMQRMRGARGKSPWLRHAVQREYGASSEGGTCTWAGRSHLGWAGWSAVCIGPDRLHLLRLWGIAWDPVSSEGQKQRKGLKYWWPWPRPLAEEPKDSKDRQRLF